MASATLFEHRVEALIMAGGRGERLHPLTDYLPKPIIPFGGIFRIVDFTLGNCLNSGVSRVSLLTQYRHEELQSYIRRRWNGLWNEVTQKPLLCTPSSGDQPYRGTADAVFQNITALRQSRSDIVLILSADQVYKMDYRDFSRYHAETDADLTIATVEQPLTAAKHFGVVETDDEHRVVGFQEKPDNPRPIPARPTSARISMGVYAFKKDVLLQALSESCASGKGYDFGHDILPSLVGSANIRAYDFRDPVKSQAGYWRDIGTLDSYYQTNMDLTQEEMPFDPYGNEGWLSYRNSDPTPSQMLARLSAKCHITGSVLSPGVVIEDGSEIDSSVLMPGVQIGRDTRIRHAIIEEDIHIPSGCRIGFDLENDRKNYLVTDTGVVIVSRTPRLARPIVICALRRNRPRHVRVSRAA